VPCRSRRSVGLAVALLAAAVVSLAACDLARVTGPRQWMDSAQLAAGGTYVVAVRDTSGRIDNVEIDPADAGPVPDAVSNPPGQPNVLLVSWTGGACDERTDVDIAATGPGLGITIRTTVANRDCDAIGIGHVLRLTSSQPLPPAAVQVTTTP
jgi:hypothetical protein